MELPAGIECAKLEGSLAWQDVVDVGDDAKFEITKQALELAQETEQKLQVPTACRLRTLTRFLCHRSEAREDQAWVYWHLAAQWSRYANTSLACRRSSTLLMASSTKAGNVVLGALALRLTSTGTVGWIPSSN